MGKRTLRLRLWLAAMDVAHALRLPRTAYLWCVARASNATDRGPPFEAMDAEGEAPF